MGVRSLTGAASERPLNERSEINVGSGVRGQAGLGEY
jgi:hypothetical protein